MRRSYAWRDGRLVELTPQQVEALPYVQDDIQEFRSPDGTLIRGKRQWREHLAKTGTMEMGHSDLAAAKAKWSQRKSGFQAKIAAAEQFVKEVTPPEGEIREPMDRTRVNAEVMNRLDGRPVPERKQLIKLALDVARRYGRS